MTAIQDEIRQLKFERQAVIIAHNYELPEVQDLADFTGDSLELSRRAAEIEAEVIVFCGVHFMAETAAILNPDKTVLLPHQQAGCAMADMINARQLRELKARHPEAMTVCYVNSSAAIKAESDCCCTSANAVRVVESMGKDTPVIFVPDRNLGGYVAEQLGRDLILFDGCCPVHDEIDPDAVARVKTAHPKALTLAHPECPKPVRDLADHILSTGQMVKQVGTLDADEFIIVTETGINHRLSKENPNKTFLTPDQPVICEDMKKITPETVRDSLKNNQYPITVDEPIRSGARKAIERMLALA